jgi:hypothetical protein
MKGERERERIIGLQMGKKTDKFYYFTTSLCIYYWKRVVKARESCYISGEREREAGIA